jgi:hypothetical protein
MPDQPCPPDVDATNPDEARAQLHQIIDRLPDDPLLALWRYVCWWVLPRPRQRQR